VTQKVESLAADLKKRTDNREITSNEVLGINFSILNTSQISAPSILNTLNH
jgi:hypothetical protein